MWAEVAELAEAVCMDTAGWYDVDGEPIDWAVSGARDGAPEGGYADDDGDGKVRCGREDIPGDPFLGYAEPGTDSEGAGDLAPKSIDTLLASGPTNPDVGCTSSGEAPERGRLDPGKSSWSHRSAGRFSGFGGDTFPEGMPENEVDGCW